MSVKRGAERYLTKDDVSDPRMNTGGPDNSEDPVQRATAAQLANRKIKAAKGRRPGGAPARPTTSFGSSLSTPQPGLFTNGAQSFPPTNGAAPIGNGSPNVSFGGFGSGSGSSGFDFSSSAPVNNPFANLSSSTATNGASNGGFGFNFGGSQPAAAPAPSAGIFSFGGNQQPAASSFPSATSQAPSTGLFGSSTAPSSNIFGTPASSAAPGAGIFGSTNGGSTFGTTNGGGLFGSAPSTSQQPSGGSLFGQPPVQTTTEAPFKTFFGAPAQAVKTPFGQPVDDVMSTSPDNSPNRNGNKPVSNNWNKSFETVANGVASSSSSNGGESPDQPHIEDEPRPNPFALIPRAPSSEPPKAVEKPSKSIFSTEKSEEDRPHITDNLETLKANPSASVARQTQSAPKTADTQPKPNFSQTATPATSNMFNLGKPNTGSEPSFTSSTNSATPPTAKSSIFSPIVTKSPIVGQSPIVGEENSSKAKVESTFNSTSPSSSISKPQAPSTNIFGMSSKSTQAANASPSQDKMVDSATVARLREVGTVLPQDRLRDLSKHVTPAFRASILSEDTLSFPSAESGMDKEEIKYWARERKLHRLNDIYKNFFLTRGNESDFEWTDLRPMMANYITMFEEIMTPIEGPLSKLIAAYGKDQGYRLFYQQNGSMPDDSGKRKPGIDISREDDHSKKARIEAPPPQSVTQPSNQSVQSSATANKFMNFLGQSDDSTPSKSSKSNEPVNGTTQKQTAAEPAFKMPTFNPSANFMATFGQEAAKAAAKAKQKAKDEEFDSDEDDPVEWERQYDEKLAAKAAKLKEVQKSGTGFQFKPSAPPSAPASSLAPPSTNGGFNFSRSVSPAASATGSVFDAARPSTPSGSNNIFGHLSNAGSDVEGSARGDADDEDSEEDDSQHSNGANTSNNQSNGRFGGFSESDDAPGDTPAAGRSLFDRIEKRAETPTSSTNNNPFGFPKPAEQDNSAPSGGLFERVSREASSERTPLAATAANDGGLFGFGTKVATAGDQTWKPDSPIRFNNSTAEPSNEPPKFSFTASTPSKTSASTGFAFQPIGSTTTTSSSLFGASIPRSSLFGASKPGQSLFPPSGSPSVLASATTSRATTPGVSDVSGAETTGGEQEEASKDPQIGDLVGMEEAKQGHDVLFENNNAKASRFEKDYAEKKTAPWSTQGVGPITVLKDQATGVTKILMKKVPSGGIVLNTRLMSQVKYEHLGKRARFGVFDPVTNKPESWIIQFGSVDEAADFVKVCDENKNQ